MKGSNRLARIAVAVYSAALAVIVFWPTSVEKAIDPQIGSRIGAAKRAGAPKWFNYGNLEAVANVLLFIPLGALLALALTRAKWWLAGILGAAASVAIESSQMLFLANRTPSFFDVALNTAGAALGAAGVALARRGK